MANRGGAPKRYPSDAKQSRFVRQIIRWFGSAKHKQSSSQTDAPKLLITPSSTEGPRGSKDAQPGQNLGAIVNHEYDFQYDKEAFYNTCPSYVREKVRKHFTTELSRFNMFKTSTHRKISYRLGSALSGSNLGEKFKHFAIWESDKFGHPVEHLASPTDQPRNRLEIKLH